MRAGRICPCTDLGSAPECTIHVAHDVRKQRQSTRTRPRLSAYAKLAGIRPSYVQRLVAEGKLPTLPDGSLNPLACDEARRRTTVVGKGQRRWARRHGAAR